MVNWQSAENKERLLACLFASIEDSGAKVNYKRIAELFGQGTTGNAIECNFRKIRAQSKEVRKEYESGATAQAAASAPSTPRKPKTPKKDAMSAVKNGRVEKPASPTKKVYPNSIKIEEMPTPPAEVINYLTMDSFGTSYDSSFGLPYHHSFDDEI